MISIEEINLLKSQNEELQKDLLSKTAECEELKDKINFMEGYIETVETARNEIEKELKKECEKYEQALNEIKEICLKDVHTFADGTELRYDSLDDILDIISKAKDGKNG